MQTIKANVHPRLLTKADRLFTGQSDGRMIEILQNARRAGATEVRITNQENHVTVQDNGCGIDDFQKLLDLGNSGWDEKLEQGEDAAGVGLFCLAPRDVTITSGNQTVTISKDGWTGQPVEVTKIEQSIKGARLEFCDDQPWDFETVQKHAVFSGLKVIVDGKYCHTLPFCSPDSTEYSDLGCQIEVVSELSNYHRKWTTYSYQSQTLVNFHGQVVELDYWPGDSQRGIHILVNLTEQTAIRLMLPARTKVIENAALERLKTAIEVEYYRYFQRQKEHTLSYSEYLRSKELGVDLPESKPVYSVNLLCDSYDMAVQVVEPKDFKISDGYLYLDEDFENEHDTTNVHLLAALGKFNGKPFMPVMINKGYFGYSWTNLPKITSVKVKSGKERLSRWISSGTLCCVDSLSIAVTTSDGKVFESDVSLAVIELEPNEERKWYDESVHITESARLELEYDNLWYHLGGYNEDGDTYDTQQYYIEKELNEFWSALIGPYEQLRHELLSQINLNCDLNGKWQQVIISENGTITIHFKDGNIETVKPAIDS